MHPVNTPKAGGRRPSQQGIRVMGARQPLGSDRASHSSSERHLRGVTITSLSREKVQGSSGRSKASNGEGDGTGVSRDNVSEFGRQPSHSEHVESQADKGNALLKAKRAEEEWEVEQLREKLAENEQKIGNLIDTLNLLVERAARRETLYNKLTARLASIATHQTQCYSYCLNRIADAQKRMGLIGEEVRSREGMAAEWRVRVENVGLISRDVFQLQREKVWGAVSGMEREVRAVEERVEREVGDMGQLRGRCESGLAQMKARMEEVRQNMGQLTRSSQMPHMDQDRQQEADLSTELRLRLDSLAGHLSNLEHSQHQQRQLYTAAESTSQKAIYELSTLLHQHERELQASRRANGQLQHYNRELENRLIDLRLKEGVSGAEAEEYDRVLQEREKYRQRYEEAFRQAQVREEEQCTLRLSLSRLTQQVRELEAERDSLRGEVESKAEPILRLKQLGQQVAQLHELLAGRELQLSQARRQLEEVTGTSQQLRTALVRARGEFEEEQEYSSHLQAENEALEGRINEYTQHFKQQSEVFRSTIRKLQSQQSASSASSASNSESHQQEQKALREGPNNCAELKQALTGQALPVLCERDVGGCLRTHSSGQYLYDSRGSPFELSEAEVEWSVINGLIALCSQP